MLLFHVLVALTSMVLATLAAMKPSAIRLRSSKVTMVLTLVSGTYIVVQGHASLLRACFSGLAYLLFVSILIFVAQRKFAAEQITDL
jgi:hypothetical protein